MRPRRTSRSPHQTPSSPRDSPTTDGEPRYGLAVHPKPRPVGRPPLERRVERHPRSVKLSPAPSPSNVVWLLHIVSWTVARVPSWLVHVGSRCLVAPAWRLENLIPAYLTALRSSARARANTGRIEAKLIPLPSDMIALDRVDEASSESVRGLGSSARPRRRDRLRACLPRFRIDRQHRRHAEFRGSASGAAGTPRHSPRDHTGGAVSPLSMRPRQALEAPVWRDSHQCLRDAQRYDLRVGQRGPRVSWLRWQEIVCAAVNSNTEAIEVGVHHDPQSRWCSKHRRLRFPCLNAFRRKSSGGNPAMTSEKPPRRAFSMKVRLRSACSAVSARGCVLSRARRRTRSGARRMISRAT